MFKPLFKYTGGKYEEYKKINNFSQRSSTIIMNPFSEAAACFFNCRMKIKSKGILL